MARAAHRTLLPGLAIVPALCRIASAAPWDQLDLRAALAWRWRPTVELGAWLGPSFGGNFGGLTIQNTWHGWSGTGPTVDGGLQNAYPGGRRVGIVAGGRASGTIGGDVGAYGDATAQLALGATGVTLLDVNAVARAMHTSRSQIHRLCRRFGIDLRAHRVKA